MKKLKNIKVLKFNIPNKNGRIYSSDCINLDDPVLKDQLANKCLFGELGFPQDERTTTIDTLKVSHVITKLKKKKDGLYADIEILDTPCGKILEQKVNKNNFRTRGTGDLVYKSLSDSIKGIYTVEDYQFITIDYTDNPA